MTPAVAHRLLNAPTATWTAYQSDSPNWGHDIARCLRAGTISPLAVTHNLRKLTDCMAQPDIQPLLCDWFAKHYVLHSQTKRDKFERVQDGLSKCVRSLQLQAISQGNLINILPRTSQLAELSGNPLEANGLWHSWLLLEEDVYTTAQRNHEYFTNGKSLGDKAHLQKTLSHYKKFVVEAMAMDPTIAKDLKSCLSIDTTRAIAGARTSMAQALLWEHGRLNLPLKYALAYNWANDKSTWSTCVQDRLLSPKKTKYWDAWALHAQTYIQVASSGPVDFHGSLNILKTCPPLSHNKEKLDSLDSNIFSDMQTVLN